MIKASMFWSKLPSNLQLLEVNDILVVFLYILTGVLSIFTSCITVKISSDLLQKKKPAILWYTTSTICQKTAYTWGAGDGDGDAYVHLKTHLSYLLVSH